jgi:hypothetical protein
MPQCSVSPRELFGALLSGQFRRLTEEELDAWIGFEGEGWLWDSRLDGTIVTADHTPAGIVFNVIEPDGGPGTPN